MTKSVLVFVLVIQCAFVDGAFKVEDNTAGGTFPTSASDSLTDPSDFPSQTNPNSGIEIDVVGDGEKFEVLERPNETVDASSTSTIDPPTDPQTIPDSGNGTDGSVPNNESTDDVAISSEEKPNKLVNGTEPVIEAPTVVGGNETDDKNHITTLQPSESSEPGETNTNDMDKNAGIESNNVTDMFGDNAKPSSEPDEENKDVLDSDEGNEPDVQTETGEGSKPDVQKESDEGIEPDVQTETGEGSEPDVQTETGEGSEPDVQTETDEGEDDPETDDTMQSSDNGKPSTDDEGDSGDLPSDDKTQPISHTITTNFYDPYQKDEHDVISDDMISTTTPSTDEVEGIGDVIEQFVDVPGGNDLGDFYDKESKIYDEMMDDEEETMLGGYSTVTYFLAAALLCAIIYVGYNYRHRFLPGRRRGNYQYQRLSHPRDLPHAM